MPVYEYKGKFYDLSETDPTAAKAKIVSTLDKQYEEKRSSVLDVLPKGTPSFMQSKPGQGWDDAAAAGGDPTNPMAYLSESQKTEQGPAMQTVSQGVNRAVQVGAGVAKGAVINPAAAVAQVVGGKGGREFAQAAQESYDTQRKNAGAEGFDWAELAGAVVSPVNKFIPSGSTGVVGRGAIGGVVGGILNPVAGTDLSAEDVLAGKVEQAGIGAIAGRVGAKFADMLTPTLKTGVRELMDQGIPVSPGQAYEGIPGALYRQIEKLDLPFLRVNKEAINLGYTKSVGDDVLSSVGKTVPDTVKNGQQAFTYINKELNNAYDTAIEKIGTVKIDDEFKSALDATRTAVRDSLDAKQAAGFNKFVKDNIVSRVNANNGDLTGKDLKKLETIFRDKIDSIKAVDTPGETLKTAYDDAYKAIKAFTLRNDADGSIAAANTGWMKQARFMEGVNANAAATKGAQGTFTPAEMAKIASKQGNEFEAAKGVAPLQAQANKALDIVGDTTQEAQKFRTLMIAGKLTGLGALGLFSPAIALPLLTGAGISYKAAQGLMQDPGKLRLAVQNALKENPGLLGQAAVNIREQLNNSGPNTPPAAPAAPGQPAQPQQPRSFLNNLYPKLNSTVVGTAGRFDPLHPIAEQIRAEADRQGMSEFKDLLVRQAFQESKFNPDARSNKKAGGVMQIIPGTAKELGVKNVFDAADNIRGGVKYMKQLLEKYDNDPEKALAAYNWGPGRVDKLGLSRMPLETKGYITNILGKDI
jgi:hypothetical protein